MQCFQRTSEPSFVNGLKEFLNTGPVQLLQLLTAPGQRLTHHHSNHLGPGSTHSFRQTKQCMVCSHTWVLRWASGGWNEVVLLFARQSDCRAECGLTPPCPHPEYNQVWRSVHTEHCPVLSLQRPCSRFLHNPSTPEQTVKIPGLFFKEMNSFGSPTSCCKNVLVFFFF